ncbi:hypothetical protein AB0D32_25090 [Micromonospora sp. NPDC048170]|uniref:hypothetical protein n=1 Tax=Micromonospora sp. NPDC048170 TaxID=3154819 RepID=UPI0033F92ECC
MLEFEYVATTAAFQAPTVLVVLVGLVLAATAGQRLSRKPRLLAFSGLGVLLVSTVLNVAWNLLLPRLFDADWGRRTSHCSTWPTAGCWPWRTRSGRVC